MDYSEFKYAVAIPWDTLYNYHKNGSIVNCNDQYLKLYPRPKLANTSSNYVLNKDLVNESNKQIGAQKLIYMVKDGCSLNVLQDYSRNGRNTIIAVLTSRIYFAPTSANSNDNAFKLPILYNDLTDEEKEYLNKYGGNTNGQKGLIYGYVSWTDIRNNCTVLTNVSEFKNMRYDSDKKQYYKETYKTNVAINSENIKGAEPFVESTAKGKQNNTKVMKDTPKNIQKYLDDVKKKQLEDIGKVEGILGDSKKNWTQYIKDWINEKTSIASKSARYRESLKTLDIKKLRAIFGLPYQFLPTSDLRIDGSYNDHVFGTVYSEMIASKMNLLHLTPCNSSFMANYSSSERKTLFGNLISFFGSGDANNLNNLVEDYSGKLYSTIPAYSEYFKYVNPMIRSCAVFLGLYQGNEKYANNESYVKYKGQYLAGTTSKSFNWGWNNMGDYNGDYSGNDEGGTNNNGFSKIVSDLSNFQDVMYYRNSIPFYISNSASISETFNNETTESMISSVLSGFSDKARELQFLVGTTSRVIASQFDTLGDDVAKAKQTVEGLVNKLSSGNNIFGQLVGGVKTIVSGGRMMFPNIWSNSTYSKSYTINIKLTSPSCDPKSILLNILAPLCHLTAFVFPRGEYINGYSAPFLVKAFCKGQFNIDMGIVTDLSFEKGKEGTWTSDGLPTVVDVTMTITDLYPTMSMTPSGALFKSNVLKNIAEMDFLANMCGVNINQPDLGRVALLYEILNINNPVSDFVPNLESDLLNMFTNKISSLGHLFGKV